MRNFIFLSLFTFSALSNGSSINPIGSGGGGGGGGTWGSITGTLSDQTDLQTALDGKVGDSGDETIAGTKTFSSAPICSALTASKLVVTDGSKALSSSSLGTSDIVATSGDQTVAGVKTFSSAPIMSALTASRAVVTDGSKALSSLEYTSSNTVSTLVQRDGSGNFTAGTITAALSGNATTATALASNPTDCGASQYATAIDASGNLTCSAVTAVTGPGSSTDNAIVRFDGTGGTTVQNSVNTIADTTGAISMGGGSGANITWATNKAGSIGATGANSPATYFAAGDSNGLALEVGKPDNTNGSLGGISLYGGTGSTTPKLVMTASGTSNHSDIVTGSTGFIFRYNDAEKFQMSTNELHFRGSSSAHLKWDNDGAGDIGASGGERPNHIYSKLSMVAGSRMTSAVVTLTDGATPALDASLGNTFVLTAAGNRTIAVPSNAVSGQKITIVHIASGADRTLALNTGAGGFRFGTDITALTATTSGKTDYIGAIYNATSSTWDVVAYAKGY